MSIINDALRKVQSKIEQKDNQKSDQKYKTPPTQHQINKKYREPLKDSRHQMPASNTNYLPQRPFISSMFLSLLIIISIITIIFFAPIIIKYIFPNAQGTRVKKTQIAIPREESQSPAPSITSPTVNTEAGSIEIPEAVKNPTLSGIVISKEEKFAVIDDDVYTVGDFIHDMKVTAINAKTVELKKDGKKIILDVRDTK